MFTINIKTTLDKVWLSSKLHLLLCEKQGNLIMPLEKLRKVDISAKTTITPPVLWLI